MADTSAFREYDNDDPNVFHDDEDMEQEVTDDGKKHGFPEYIYQSLLTAFLARPVDPPPKHRPS